MKCPKCAIPLTIDQQYAYCGSCGYEALDYQPPSHRMARPGAGYYAANRERLTANARHYRDTHREHVRAYWNAYYEANRERVLATQRAYRTRKRAKA